MSAFLPVKVTESWMRWLEARPGNFAELQGAPHDIGGVRFQFRIEKIAKRQLVPIEAENAVPLPQQFHIYIIALPLTNHSIPLPPLATLATVQKRLLGELNWTPQTGEISVLQDTKFTGQSWYPVDWYTQVVVKRFEVTHFGFVVPTTAATPPSPSPSSSSSSEKVEASGSEGGGGSLPRILPPPSLCSLQLGMQALLSVTPRGALAEHAIAFFSSSFPNSSWHWKGQPSPAHAALLCRQLAGPAVAAIPPDVLLKTTADGRLIRAHRFVLQMRSPFFGRFFAANPPPPPPPPPQLPQETMVANIEVADFSGLAMETVIAYLYGRPPPPGWQAIAEEVAHVAFKVFADLFCCFSVINYSITNPKFCLSLSNPRFSTKFRRCCTPPWTRCA